MRTGLVMACAAGLLAAGLSAATPAGESVTVPWEEFKRLYEESVRREVMQGLPAREAPAAAAIEEAVYRLKVGEQSASVSVLLTGRTPAGRAEALRLFGGDVIVASTGAFRGGALSARDGGLALLPEPDSEFQVELSLLLPVGEDGRSKLAGFRPPVALRNSLVVELPQGTKLASAPGLDGGDGTFHFPGGQDVEVRFEAASRTQAAAPPEIDVLTRLGIQGRRLVLDTCLVPARPLPGPVTMRLPAGAQYSGSSLKASWIEKPAEAGLRINLPQGFDDVITLQCFIERGEEDGESELELPAVADNVGREGFLVVSEPDDAEVRVSGAGLASGIPQSRIPAALRGIAAGSGGYLRAAPGGSVKLSTRRYRTVAAPEVVLDAIHFFTAFDEAGGALSVLRLKLPASAGNRLRLKRVEGAEIWSLRVNDAQKEVYSLDGDSWIVPLAGDRDSKVELAFLRRGGKLGLQGRLDLVLPEVDISARELFVGAALPARVDLLSVEGDLSPAAGDAMPVPAEFTGRRHFFSRSFYKGEGLKAGLFYKEPVEREKGIGRSRTAREDRS
jgi:hypothetical protein